jgi:hypothetical protein
MRGPVIVVRPVLAVVVAGATPVVARATPPGHVPILPLASRGGARAHGTADIERRADDRDDDRHAKTQDQNHLTIR